MQRLFFDNFLFDISKSLNLCIFVRLYSNRYICTMQIYTYISYLQIKSEKKVYFFINFLKPFDYECITI